MSCDGAALPFQAHANYRTWSTDFGVLKVRKVVVKNHVQDLD